MENHKNPHVVRTVRSSETVPLGRHTINGLLEVIRATLRKGPKVARIQYIRGEDLIVERDLPAKEDVDGDGSGFITPYQVIRQHAQVAIQEPEFSPIESVCRAVQQLHEDGYALTAIVALNRNAVRDWVGKSVRLQILFRAPLLEDPETPEGCVFICGSKMGDMVSDIEYAVLCRLE